jgi:ABC-type uncharacterized transport system substrate-binding protein
MSRRSPAPPVLWFIVLAAAAAVAAAPGRCADAGAAAADVRGRKVFYLDSYDPTFQPSVLTQKGARDVLDPAGVVTEVFYLDEKANPSAEAMRKAAETARARIAAWKPDLVIASDDPANKHVVVPWYRGTDLPVVFNGVNWDAAQYGYPARNVTGQVEVELVRELLAELRTHARGGRVGFLSGDTSTDRQNLAWYGKVLGISFDRTALVKTFAEWRQAYAALQRDVDLVLLRTNGGIDGWDDAAAAQLVLEATRIPSGSVAPHMGRFVLVSFAKVREEFGEHSARTALAILRGASPADIPLSANRQARVLVNMRLAKALGIRFPVEFLERATFVEEARP